MRRSVSNKQELNFGANIRHTVRVWTFPLCTSDFSQKPIPVQTSTSMNSERNKIQFHLQQAGATYIYARLRLWSHNNELSIMFHKVLVLVKRKILKAPWQIWSGKRISFFYQERDSLKSKKIKIKWLSPQERGWDEDKKYLHISSPIPAGKNCSRCQPRCACLWS